MCDVWFPEQTLLKIVMEFNEKNAPILASIGCNDRTTFQLSYGCSPARSAETYE